MPALTPGAWLQLLEGRLANQQKAERLYCNAYDGHRHGRYATQKWFDAFGAIFGPFSDNWMQIVVDAAAERLKVVGFRFGPERDDEAAWKELWQPNNLDVESRIVHTEAIKVGLAFTLTDPTPDGPVITGETASEVAVATSPTNRRIRLAAIKRWWDQNDEYARANLYLPDSVIKYRSQNKLKNGLAMGGRVDWGEGQMETNPLGEVPVVPFFNRPGMTYGGRSDLDTAIPLQDAIDKVVQDLLVTSEFQAFPQRAIMGWEPPTGEDGKVLPGVDLKMAASRVWTFKDDNVKLQELAAANLGNYAPVIEMLVQHLSAQTRTPPHYLVATMANVSGDALKTAEAGLVFRCWDKIEAFSDPWEDTMRLGFKALRDQKANATDAETLWKDPENKSEAERIDATTKLVSIGVPLEVALERAGYSAKEIAHMKTFDGFGVPPRLSPALTGANGAGGA